MSYLNKISSLEEKAAAQLAINLCQKNSFKEIAMCLEKPTYGAFIDEYEFALFVTDQKKLSAWAKTKDYKVKEDYSPCMAILKSRCDSMEKARLREKAIAEQCQRLTEGLPRSLKLGVNPWIIRIAFEYLTYSRRQEVLFGVSRYFLMNFLTRKDWTAVCRLDEKKLAKRLLKDKRLTVLQRYRIACVYCLHLSIPRLWKRLTRKQKQSISGNDKPKRSQESHSLVLLWSYRMDRHREAKVLGKTNLWLYAARQAIYYGNRVALTVCWRKLKKHMRQQIVIYMALECLHTWQSIDKELYHWPVWTEKLISYIMHRKQSDDYIKDLNVPSHFKDFIHFFLSQMDEEQKLTFFKKAFQNSYSDSVVEHFLDWPHQDDFLPTINRLWGIIPEDKYGQCLLTLARKYGEGGEEEDPYYDYQCLLWMLWEETPEEYKRYVSLHKNCGEVLIRLLQRSPFEKKDEAFFRRVFCHLPQEERRAMMHSEIGEQICLTLTQKEKWSFVDWLLEECLTKGEIPSIKKQFIQSDSGRRLCLYKLEENHEKLVEDLIDWSFELDAEKTQFKYKLVGGGDWDLDAEQTRLRYHLFSNDECLNICDRLLRKGEFTKVEDMIYFCLSSDEMKKQSKERFAKFTCIGLLKDYAWEQMDEILAWGFDTEEKIRNVKKFLFSWNGFNTYYKLLFDRQREEIESFCAWFNLSSEEIEELKKDIICVCTAQLIDAINEESYNYTNIVVAPLRWCLTDEKMVISLKKQVEEECFKQLLDKEEARERLDYLVNELLHGFRKGEVEGKTSRENSLSKDTGEKKNLLK